MWNRTALEVHLEVRGRAGARRFRERRFIKAYGLMQALT